MGENGQRAEPAGDGGGKGGRSRSHLTSRGLPCVPQLLTIKSSAVTLSTSINHWSESPPRELPWQIFPCLNLSYIEKEEKRESSVISVTDSMKP